jgi:glutamate racemase
VTQPSLVAETVAVLGTPGTVASGSYALELAKLAPRLRLIEHACPLWVPLVEAGETSGPGADFFLHKHLDPLFARPDSPSRVLLGCTHYPLLWSGIRAIVPPAVELIAQGELVAERLADWLVRHPEMERRLSRGATRRYGTTDDPLWFAAQGEPVMRALMEVEKVRLPVWRTSE